MVRAVFVLAALVAAAVAAADGHRDTYLEEARSECAGRKDAVACAKVRALAYLDGVAGGQVEQI
jgi:hypothetical protein